MPTAQEEQSRQAGHSNHVGVLGHEEHGEFHSTVFRVIAGDQFGFRLRQIEGDAVGLGKRRHQVNKESHGLAMEQIPAGNKTPECAALGIHDFAQAEATRHDQHSN